MSSHELALLLAVATPIVVIAGLNVFLALGGERDTLLLPLPRALVFGEPGEDVVPVPAATVAVAEPRTVPQEEQPVVPAPAEGFGGARQNRPIPAFRSAISALRRFWLAQPAVRT